MSTQRPFDAVTHNGRAAIIVSTTNGAPSVVAYEGGEQVSVTGPCTPLIVDDNARLFRDCLPNHHIVRVDGEYRHLSDWPADEREAVWEKRGEHREEA